MSQDVAVDDLNNYLLVRFTNRKSFKEWTEDSPNAQKLAEDFLDSKSKECSVYKFESVEDKTRIMSAHYTSLNRDRVEKVASIEIKGSFIQEVGLSLKKSMGKTGILFIDEKHHDMCGEASQFEALILKIIENYFSGAQPFVSFEPEQMTRFIQEYVSYDGTKIKDYALARCKKALRMP